MIGKRYHKIYYENGNLQAELPYLNDEIHGVLKYYTEDKKLLVTINAQNNNYISSKCHNSKTLTGEEISTLETSETSAAFFRFLHEICLPNL
ncbi:hypothetical protein [Helicobacter bilis]|uniref:hypothetical protein n=1 Tax=Helicobacter bilis TaxID=37372 RepID=UPI00248F0BD6|nr:hypothetical protein [Helicobacter bilis]